MAHSVRTRFAPSPTGDLHIGSVRTALFSWLYARHYQGDFILRIEDTDQHRSSAASTQAILDAMRWLGLDYQEGPYYQTQRYDRYQEIIQHLLSEDKAYHCYCSQQTIDQIRADAISRGEKPRYDRRCRQQQGRPMDKAGSVIRFKNPLQGKVTVADHVKGTVVYDNLELDDLIIARADGTPTYNLVVVVDDIDMQISHVIRGDDHLNNTPRQINIFHALGATVPEYAHIPLILDQGNKKRLSKRDGAANVLKYKEAGYLPEALLNYLVRLGWAHGDQEIFSINEMIEYFSLQDLNKSAASIDSQKLLWLNQHYIKCGDDAQLGKGLEGVFAQLGINTEHGADLLELVAVQKQRSKTLLEMAEASRFFYLDFDDYDADIAAKYLHPEIREALEMIRQDLVKLDAWTDQNLHQIIVDTATKCEMKLGKIAQPLRVAITGGTVSPSIDATLRLIGKEKVLRRLDAALRYIR